MSLYKAVTLYGPQHSVIKGLPCLSKCTYVYFLFYRQIFLTNPGRFGPGSFRPGSFRPESFRPNLGVGRFGLGRWVDSALGRFGPESFRPKIDR